MHDEPKSWSYGPTLGLILVTAFFWWIKAPWWACLLGGMVNYSIAFQHVEANRDVRRWSAVLGMVASRRE